MTRITVNVRTKVDPHKHLEFEQTIIGLLEEIDKSKECLRWNVFKEIKNENARKGNQNMCGVRLDYEIKSLF